MVQEKTEDIEYVNVFYLVGSWKLKGSVGDDVKAE